VKSSMTETIRIRPFRDDDISGVLAVMRGALGETPLLQRTGELFAWKHFQNPFGRSLLLVAEVEGRVVGLRAFMRWELLTPTGQRLRCVRAVDTATDPAYHRRGIFRRLTVHAVDMARADGVDLVFNTPNERSRPGYLSMGWSNVGPVGVMVRPHGLRWLRRGSRSVTGSVVGAELLEAPHPVGIPAPEDRHPRGLRTPRDDNYLMWRFCGHPTARYYEFRTSDGLAVVRPNERNGRRELVLSDALGAGALGAIRKAVHSSRADYTVAWFSNGSPERRAARRCGLLGVPGRHALHLVAYPLRPLPLDVTSIDSWDLALGDLELL